MRLTPWLGVIMVVAAASPAAADIYVWRDNLSVSHYTNDLSNVPPEFRGDAMTVAKDWARAEPPPEAAEAAPVTAPAAAAVPARDVYEAAYLAGVHAGEQEPPPAPASSSSFVVQNVQVQPQIGIVADRLMPVPVIVERRQPPRRERQRDGGGRNNFPPASRAPFLQGPAGPPPVSDR